MPTSHVKNYNMFLYQSQENNIHLEDVARLGISPSGDPDISGTIYRGSTSILCKVGTMVPSSMDPKSQGPHVPILCPARAHT